MKKTFAIDIDGTLTMETDGHEYGERTPNLKRIAGVNALYAEGHHITLFSSRFHEDWLVTMEWLRDNNVNFHGLILGKPQYDFIIDDKAKSPDFLEAVVHNYTGSMASIFRPDKG